MYPSLRRFRKGFEVLAQPAAPTNPCQRSFDHPSPRQDLKVMAAPRASHDLQYPTRQGHHPTDQLASVTSISPNQSQERKPSHQFVDNQPCSVSVLDVSGVDHDSQQQPYGIDGDVAFAAGHLLTSIIAARPPFSVVFTDWLSMMAALGVGSLPSKRRTFGRSTSWTRSHVPVLSPLSEVPPCRPPGRQVVRERTPCTSVAQNIQNAVDDFPQFHCAGPASGLGWWEQGTENLPLFVR